MKKLCVNIVRGIIWLMSRLPLKFHYFMGGILAWIAKNIFRYRYPVVLTNIARSFPGNDYALPKKITDDFYRHFGEIAAEFIWFGGSSYKRVIRKGLVKVTNPEVLTEYFDNSPSTTILSTHCGNWEILGGIFAYFDATGKRHPLTKERLRVVYKKLSSAVSDEVFKRNRAYPIGEGGDQCLVESTNILRYAISHRNEKMVYMYPADQAPYWYAGKHFIGDFMNQPTYAMQGSMGVACKLSHSVLYMQMKRVKRGQYEMTFVPICEDASKMTPEAILRKYYDLLEEEIRQTPANWLWSHKRWK